MNKSIYQKILKDRLIDDDVITEDSTPPGFLSTGVMALNLAFGGKIDHGIPIGKIAMFAAPAQQGKSLVGILVAKDAQEKGMFVVWVDGEYAFNFDVAPRIGMKTDKENFYLYQENQIEKVQSKIMKIVEGLSREERQKILIVIDSWNSLINVEAIEKSKDVDAKKDMNDTIKKNKLANYLLNTKTTVYVINHVYDNVGGFGDPLRIPGGKRIYYNSQSVVLGRSKAKDEQVINKEDVIVGSIISCRVDKSRYSKERSELCFRIKYNGGLDIFYGILDDAVAGGFVTKTETGYYFHAHDKDAKKWREKDLYCAEFWLPVFTETKFREYLETQYTFTGTFDVSTSNFYQKLESAKPREAKEAPAETSKEQPK